jgi:Fe-S-cluster containining protein
MPGSPAPREWFSEGLRFECTSCGQCCTGPPGVVEFTRGEGLRMARNLGLGYREFLSLHAMQIDGGWSLQEIPDPEGQGLDCTMLDRQSVPGKALCRVYPARPQQCRTWPFWPENLYSPHAWRRAGRRCPGMDRGELVTLDEIRRRMEPRPSL